MVRSLFVFVPLLSSSKFELRALNIAKELAAKGKKALFAEIDCENSVLHRFKKKGSKGDIISVLKRKNTLNQVVQKTPAAPNLGIIWGNTAAADISAISKTDMSVVISDLAILMNDYDCTIIKCNPAEFAKLKFCFTENTVVILSLSPQPDCIVKAISTINTAKKADNLPRIMLRITDCEYPSQELRTFQQIQSVVALPNFDFFRSDDAVNQYLLQEVREKEESSV